MCSTMPSKFNSSQVSSNHLLKSPSMQLTLAVLLSKFVIQCKILFSTSFRRRGQTTHMPQTGTLISTKSNKPPPIITWCILVNIIAYLLLTRISNRDPSYTISLHRRGKISVADSYVQCNNNPQIKFNSIAVAYLSCSK